MTLPTLESAGNKGAISFDVERDRFDVASRDSVGSLNDPGKPCAKSDHEFALALIGRRESNGQPRARIRGFNSGITPVTGPLWRGTLRRYGAGTYPADR